MCYYLLKRKWYIYTVLVGLIPFIARLLVCIISNKINLSTLKSPIDFITLGLVVGITNINELENRNNVDGKWKTTCIGGSLMSIIVYTILIVGCIINENKYIFDNDSIFRLSLLLAFASIYFSYSIFNRLTKIEETKEV